MPCLAVVRSGVVCYQAHFQHWWSYEYSHSTGMLFRILITCCSLKCQQLSDRSSSHHSVHSCEPRVIDTHQQRARGDFTAQLAFLIPIQGPIPALYFQFPALTSLNLAKNQFSGRFHSLVMKTDVVSGSLPSVSSAIMYNTVDLTTNYLGGPLPDYTVKV